MRNSNSAGPMPSCARRHAHRVGVSKRLVSSSSVISLIISWEGVWGIVIFSGSLSFQDQSSAFLRSSKLSALNLSYMSRFPENIPRNSGSQLVKFSAAFWSSSDLHGTKRLVPSGLASRCCGGKLPVLAAATQPSATAVSRYSHQTIATTMP
jgi:hypothetical protein